jgi:hypothetical protein
LLLETRSHHPVSLPSAEDGIVRPGQDGALDGLCRIRSRLEFGRRRASHTRARRVDPAIGRRAGTSDTRQTRFGMTAYLESISLVEPLHRQFLEVVKLEIEGLGIYDINNVHGMMLFDYR